MTRLKIKELEKAAEEVVKWMAENCCPHDTVLIKIDGIELVKGECYIPQNREAK